jgi:bacteriocin-like protein
MTTTANDIGQELTEDELDQVSGGWCEIAGLVALLGASAKPNGNIGDIPRGWEEGNPKK